MPGPSPHKLMADWESRGRHVTIRGQDLFLIEHGPLSGPVVLLLHGFLHSSWTWRRNLQALAGAGLRAVALDLPGMGLSGRGRWDYSLEGYSRIAFALLDHLGVGPLHAAFGSSLGGAVALRMHLDRPERVERLVLSCSVGPPVRAPRGIRRLAIAPFGPAYALTAGNPLVIRAILRSAPAYRRIPVDSQTLAGLWPASARRGTRHTAIELAHTMPRSTRRLFAALGDVRAPSQVVWGAHDGILPLRYGRLLASRIPASDLAVFDDCAHLPHEEDPDRFDSVAASLLQAPTRKS